jgi:hypothetical protein
MNFSFFLLLTAIINFFLGFLVFLKTPQVRLKSLFFIFSLITGIWILANFMTGIYPTIFWLKSAYAFGAFVPALAILWVLILCNDKLNKLNVSIFLGLALLFFIGSFTNELIATEVTKVYLGGYEGKSGPLLPFYSLYMIGMVGFIIYKLFTSYIKAKGVNRLQLGYALLGAILWGKIAVIVSFILPLFGIMKFMPLDSPSTIIFLFFTTLAITRYHLFEIRIILTELLVGIMGIILIVLPFLMPTNLLRILTIIVFLLFCFFGYYLIKATYQEMRRREMAERLSKLKSEFVAIASHQLLTPFDHH